MQRVRHRLERCPRWKWNHCPPSVECAFSDYAGKDLLPYWSWNHVDPETAKKRLNGYLKLRGDVVHRSRASLKSTSLPHPVTRDDLQKAIFFLKEIVKATERALAVP